MSNRWSEGYMDPNLFGNSQMSISNKTRYNLTISAIKIKLKNILLNNMAFISFESSKFALALNVPISAV